MDTTTNSTQMQAPDPEWTPNRTQALVLAAVEARLGPDRAERLRQSWIAAGLKGRVTQGVDPLDCITPDELVDLVRLSRRPGARGWVARRRLAAILADRPATLPCKVPPRHRPRVQVGGGSG